MVLTEIKHKIYPKNADFSIFVDFKTFAYIMPYTSDFKPHRHHAKTKC